MGLFTNLFITIAFMLYKILDLFSWAIIIRALLSWVNPDPYNGIVIFFNRITEPILEPIRRFLPRMGIDISPLIAIFAIMGIQKFLLLTLGSSIL